MARLHVLIVDDDPDQRVSLREALEDNGCSVTEAGTGMQALSYLLSTHAEPSVILLDLRMPGMHGSKVLELLGAYAHLSSIPVIVMSGSDARREPLSRPVALRLVKPVDEKQLYAAIIEVSLRQQGPR